MKNNYSLKKRDSKNLSLFIRLICSQTFLAVLWILLIPGESEHAIFFGYSLRRLALLVPPIILAISAGTFLFTTKRNKKVQAWFSDGKKRACTARWMILFGALLSALMLAVVCFYHYLLFFPDVGAFYRLLPILSLFFLFGLELILFVPLFLYKQKQGKTKKKEAWNSPAFWITFIILILLFILIETTGLGKDPVRVSIITLGVPLLEGQIWFVGGLIMVYLFAAFAWSTIPAKEKAGKMKYQDLLIFCLIWLAAFAFWMNFPLPEHNYFAPAVRPPTFEKYPFSDAEQYDYNSLYVLFGALDDFVVSKPLYVSFLSILHFIGGFDYGTIILLQTAVVALLPAVTYLIGKELHSRLAGGGIALFMIVREANSILSSTMANVSNSKLLMSDVPATLIVAIMVLVVVRWFKLKGEKISHHIFLLGGLTAVLNLMRIQTLALIPFFIVLIIIRYFKFWKKVLLACGVFLLTVALLLAPIIISNHAVTDVYWLDNPASSSALYSFILKGSDVEINVENAATSEELLDRNFSVILAAFTQNSGQMVGFILDNFARNIISTTLILPVRLGNRIPFEDFFRMSSPFFEEVYSSPGVLNTLVLVLNLVILSIGFVKITRKKSTAGVMVLLVYLAYNLSSSIVRLSGWRFIQPVDWIMLIFFVIGIIELLHALIRHIFKHDFVYQIKERKDKIRSMPIKKLVSILAGIGFVFFCAFIPIRDGLLSDSFPEYDREQICTEIKNYILSSESDFNAKSVYDFCGEDSTSVYKGYGFYPRFFKIGEGYYNRKYDQYFGKQDYARLVFRLVGGKNGKIYIKTEQSDIPFEDGALVYVLIQEKPKADAQLVIIDGENPIIIFSDPILSGEDHF